MMKFLIALLLLPTISIAQFSSEYIAHQALYFKTDADTAYSDTIIADSIYYSKAVSTDRGFVNCATIFVDATLDDSLGYLEIIPQFFIKDAARTLSQWFNGYSKTTYNGDTVRSNNTLKYMPLGDSIESYDDVCLPNADSLRLKITYVGADSTVGLIATIYLGGKR